MSKQFFASSPSLSRYTLSSSLFALAIFPLSLPRAPPAELPITWILDSATTRQPSTVVFPIPLVFCPNLHLRRHLHFSLFPHLLLSPSTTPPERRLMRIIKLVSLTSNFSKRIPKGLAEPLDHELHKAADWFMSRTASPLTLASQKLGEDWKMELDHVQGKVLRVILSLNIALITSWKIFFFIIDFICSNKKYKFSEI